MGVGAGNPGTRRKKTVTTAGNDYIDDLKDQYRRELGRAEDARERYNGLELQYKIMRKREHPAVYTENDYARMMDDLTIALENARRLEDKATDTRTRLLSAQRLYA
jgi:hypothetical protein